MAEKNSFEELYTLNVNDHTEPKNGLTYLSWVWAVAEAEKRFPKFDHRVRLFDGKPYIYDPLTGYMVFTEITTDGEHWREMWLPVMDGANNAMKAEPYTIKTKYKEIPVAAATMTDINKALMRCLTKNISVYTGIGLYIYAGEDLPEELPKDNQTEQNARQPATQPAQARQAAPANNQPPVNNAAPTASAPATEWTETSPIPEAGGMTISEIYDVGGRDAVVTLFKATKDEGMKGMITRYMNSLPKQ